MNKKSVEKNPRRKTAKPAAAGRKTKSGKSFLRTTGFIAAGIAFVFIISLTVVAALLFDRPVAAKNTMPSFRDMQRQQKLISRVMKELKRDSNAEYISIVLKPKEMESMLKVSLFALRSSASFSDKLSRDLFPLVHGDIAYRKGYFTVNMPVDTGWRWLFGGAIYLKCRVRPEKNGNFIDLDIEDLRAGVFPLPDDLCEQLANKSCGRLFSQPEYAGYMRAIKELRINDNGSVEMICSPRLLLPLLFGGTVVR